MPAMHYRLRWPDETEATCYSPSLVIKDFFAPGAAYPLPEFLARIREATHIASERVRAKYGFACSMAHDQLGEIERTAAAFAGQGGAQVQVLSFDEGNAA
ncbi:MAG TPA: MSMEG_0570 family nitrogen starvation response protein [Ideonella sp.]|nr:MSMEG_0570 family nitrogen starvation response protein [Ideonella sp.]